MKTLVCLLFLIVSATAAQAQQRLRYAVWADGLIEPQLPKSALYAPGAGLRAEVSRPLRHGNNALFAQVGFAHLFRKATGAFTANIGLVNVGYRYQSRKAFTATVGVGVQYWRERMRIRFPDYDLDETFTNIMPGATVGIGFRISPRYTLALENRVLFKPETGSVRLRNTLALSAGYTF